MATLLQLLQAHADGQVVECVPSLGGPVICETADEVARAWLDAGCGVRLKPQLTPVDLSVLVAQGLDCEFWDTGDTGRELQIGHLSDVPGIAYKRVDGLTYDHCRPRLDHWHNHTPGDCPLPDGLKIRVRVVSGGAHGGYFYDEREFTTAPGVHAPNWNHEPGKWDLIAFEVLGTADGFCWPWEANR